MEHSAQEAFDEQVGVRAAEIRLAEEVEAAVAAATPPKADEVDDERRSSRTDDSQEKTANDEAAGHIFGWRLYVIIASLGLACILIALDSAVLATAIPTITTDFNSLPDVGWYGSAYLMSICACQPLTAKILQHYPLKWSYIAFLVVFEIGSLICALAPSSGVLIAGRAIAGLGAAGLFSGAMIIIAHIAPLQMRPAYTGIIIACYGLASVVGPVIGGAFTQNVTWRWCFYINLPLGAPVIGILLLFFRQPPNPAAQRGLRRIVALDPLGFLLFSPAVVMLLIALQWGGELYAWNSPTVVGLLCGAVLLLLVFVGWQMYLQDRASIPPSVFTQRTVFWAVLSVLAAMGGLNVINYWLPIWFQVSLDSSPTDSGVDFLPTVIANIFISILAGGLVTQLGQYMPFQLLGTALSAIAGGLLTTLTLDATRGQWIGYQVIAGLGHGLIIQMPLTAVQTVLPLEQIGTATTLIMFSQFLAGSVFLAVAENIFANRVVEELAARAPQVDAAALIAAGATSIRRVVQPQYLRPVLEAYNVAITDVFWIAGIGAAVAFFTSLGMEWRSVKAAPKPKATAPEEKASV